MNQAYLAAATPVATKTYFPAAAAAAAAVVVVAFAPSAAAAAVVVASDPSVAAVVVVASFVAGLCVSSLKKWCGGGSVKDRKEVMQIFVSTYPAECTVAVAYLAAASYL